jgi:hypothetical protein
MASLTGRKAAASRYRFMLEKWGEVGSAMLGHFQPSCGQDAIGETGRLSSSPAITRDSARPFVGAVDELAIFERVQGAGAIADLANAAKGNWCQFIGFRQITPAMRNLRHCIRIMIGASSTLNLSTWKGCQNRTQRGVLTASAHSIL